jgi:hypothetical protein
MKFRKLASSQLAASGRRYYVTIGSDYLIVTDRQTFRH